MKKITLLFLFMIALISANAQISRYLKVDATGTGDGTSWANAAGTADIQTVIDAVAADANQGTVYFAAGTYLIAAQIQLKNNVQLMGGYAADGSGTRDLWKNETILDGQFNKRILFTGDQSPYVAFTKITKMDGFILQRGSSSYGSAAAISFGTVLENCVIRNNNGSTYGAAVFIKRHATISNPTNGWNQGAALINCIVVNNTSSGYAAAIFVNQDTHFTLMNCVIANNKSTDATNGVGGLNWGQNVRYSRVSNSIFYNNSAPTSTKNNIFFANAGEVQLAIFNNYFSDATFVDVDITAGNGNKNATDIAMPGFAAETTFQGYDVTKMSEIASADWRLNSTSALLGLGSTISGRADVPYPYVTTAFGGAARAYTTVSTDIMGSNRIINSTVEMGAYEYNPVNINTAANANGTVSATQTVSKGTVVTVVATPNSGYRLLNWSNGGTIVSTSATYSFAAENDITLTASFDLGTGLKTSQNDNMLSVKGKQISISSKGSVEIYETSGRLVLKQAVDNSIIDLQKTGLFVVRLRSEQGVSTQKVYLK